MPKDVTSMELFLVAIPHNKEGSEKFLEFLKECNGIELRDKLNIKELSVKDFKTAETLGRVLDRKEIVYNINDFIKYLVVREIGIDLQEDGIPVFRET